MKKILVIIFVLTLLAAAVLGFQYFRKKSLRGPETPGKIILSDTLIPDGNSGE